LVYFEIERQKRKNAHMVKPTAEIWNGTRGHNSSSIPYGGFNILWGPFQLTNYTLTLNGGAGGSITTIGPSSLVNSAFIMAPGETLRADGPFTLQNSQLSAGTIEGSITASNHSVIAVAGSDANSGAIYLSASTLNIAGAIPQHGVFNFYTAPIAIDGRSTVNFEGISGTNAGQNFSVQSVDNRLGTVNVNDVSYIMGNTTIGANLVQTVKNGPGMFVLPGGHLTLGGAASGDTITINSGMLEFAQSPGFMRPPETASQSFTSQLAFNGTDGAVQFDGFSQLLVNVMPEVNEIQVYGNHREIADLHLAPSHAYAVGDFSVHGNELIYHHT
jgi:hypothetical protein